MPAIRTLTSPSRTMQSAAATRIRLRASSAARSRRLGSFTRCPPSGDWCLTAQSVSDARLALVTRQGSPGSASDAALTALFEPRSIAVVGASSDPAKWGHILSKRALASGSGRPGRAGEPGRRRGARASPRTPRWRTARDGLGQPVDLVVLCVPATAFVATVGEAVAAGARAVVAITAGLSELGAEGARAEAEAVAVARAGGRGAGRAQLPRHRRHRRRPAAEPRGAPGRARSRCSARAATWCSTWRRCSPSAASGSRASSRWATRPTSPWST